MKRKINYKEIRKLIEKYVFAKTQKEKDFYGKLLNKIDFF